MILKKSKALIIFVITIALVFSTIAPTLADSYRPHSELVNRFKTLYDQHPEASYEVIGKSYEGRDIYIFKIGNPNGGAVMWDGALHGWEDIGSETMYHLAKWLLESGDQYATRILQRNYVIFMPIVNMDSTVRQNRNFEYNQYGVDLNRNFKNGWTYSSSKQDYPNTYHGDSAASEPETQAVRAAMAKFRPVFYVNTHTGGSYINYDRNGDMNDVNAFLTRYNQLATEMGVQKWSTGSGGGGNGMAYGDAKEFGGTGFLFEMSSESGTWEHTNPTLAEIQNEYFPRSKPILIAMCQASESNTSSSTSTTSSSSGTTPSSSTSTTSSSSGTTPSSSTSTTSSSSGTTPSSSTSTTSSYSTSSDAYNHYNSYRYYSWRHRDYSRRTRYYGQRNRYYR